MASLIQIRKKIGCSLMVLSLFFLNLNVYAASSKLPLELRPILKDRFEHDCAVRELYDFYDDDQNLTEPLSSYVVDIKHIEKREYWSDTYTLKNVFYAKIPIRKIEISFGNLGRQYNEYLHFDLRSEQAKARFQALAFPKNLQDNTFEIRYEKNFAIVSCYWLEERYQS